jgi:hypothetical protein
MTLEQKSIIVGIFQMGMAEGLDHPFEFFTAYIRNLCFMDYRKIPEMEKAAYEAMVEFLKGSAGCEEEQDFYNKLDIIKLNEYIESWYKGRRKKLDAYYEQRKKVEGL